MGDEQTRLERRLVRGKNEGWSRVGRGESKPDSVSGGTFSRQKEQDVQMAVLRVGSTVAKSLRKKYLRVDKDRERELKVKVGSVVSAVFQSEPGRAQ